MQWLSNLRIRSRLLLVLGFAWLALALVGGFSALTITTEAQRAAHFIDTEFQAVQVLGGVRTGLGNVRRAEKDVLLHMGDETETERFTRLWQQALAQTLQAAADVQALTQGDDAQQLQTLTEGLQAYAQGFKALLHKMEIGEVNDPWAANQAMVPLTAHLGRIDAALEALSHSFSAQAATRREALAQTGAQAPWLVLSATVLVAVLAGGLVLAIVRSILVPIRELQGTSQAWGEGDLSQGLEAQGQCEIAQVRKDLGRMHQNLSQLVLQVHNGVQVVGANTSEISHANHDLAERTELAAQSLQKTATSVSQLSLAVQQTARSAQEAVGTAGRATGAAQRGEQVVAQVVQTMGEIQTSSQRIADIIGVIDGIAFQTNILALNAAVEAARAGEQGRGFAVVASEVRQLAGRSAEAAREIKDIIGASVERVQEGTAQVQAAGTTMRDILQSVGDVAQVIESIRVAAHEQDEGLRMISAAMQGIDATTQQNAAMVQQSAVGARLLAEEAGQLHRAVSVFKVAPVAETEVSNWPLALATTA